MSLPTSQPRLTSYTSRPAALPPSFLTTPAPDSTPISTHRIDFTPALPRYAASYARILDNVLSPSECATLLSLAESSAPDQSHPWQPALVNMGGNYEVAATDYRNSDRIIWDCPELVSRIVQRCFAAADGAVERELEVVSKEQGNAEAVLGERAAATQTWRFTRGNERMRFLRYGPGGFFGRHCDGSFEALADHSGKPYERTLYTLQLYLNGDGVEGGATTFWDLRDPGSRGKGWKGVKGVLGLEKEKRIDVSARMGRVLVFQHKGLVHSGEEVRGGVKFAVRTDLLFRLVTEGEGEGEDGGVGGR